VQRTDELPRSTTSRTGACLGVRGRKFWWWLLGSRFVFFLAREYCLRNLWRRIRPAADAESTPINAKLLRDNGVVVVVVVAGCMFVFISWGVLLRLNFRDSKSCFFGGDVVLVSFLVCDAKQAKRERRKPKRRHGESNKQKMENVLQTTANKQTKTKERQISCTCQSLCRCQGRMLPCVPPLQLLQLACSAKALR
jgi:hypothetical protein